jgi:hypothetical protein
MTQEAEGRPYITRDELVDKQQWSYSPVQIDRQTDKHTSHIQVVKCSFSCGVHRVLYTHTHTHTHTHTQRKSNTQTS